LAGSFEKKLDFVTVLVLLILFFAELFKGEFNVTFALKLLHHGLDTGCIEMHGSLTVVLHEGRIVD
jgi:hypothetical protein